MKLFFVLFVLSCLKPILMIASALLRPCDEKVTSNVILCIRVVVLNLCIFLPKYQYSSLISAIISVCMFCVWASSRAVTISIIYTVIRATTEFSPKRSFYENIWYTAVHHFVVACAYPLFFFFVVPVHFVDV